MDIYDRDGLPIDIESWSWLWADPAYKRVASTWLAGPGIEVSTVWLGLDHSYSESGAPLIFETMVFDADGNDLFHLQERYTTEEAAVAGHGEAVTVILTALDHGHVIHEP